MLAGLAGNYCSVWLMIYRNLHSLLKLIKSLVIYFYLISLGGFLAVEWKYLVVE
jgi:hypothetical protein